MSASKKLVLPQPITRVQRNTRRRQDANPDSEDFEQDFCGVTVCCSGVIRSRERLVGDGHVQELAQRLPALTQVHFQQLLLGHDGSDSVMMSLQDICPWNQQQFSYRLLKVERKSDTYEDRPS